MAEQYRNYMGYLWFQKEDNVYTVGLNEDALEDFDSIESLEMPTENEVVENDVSCGTIETDTGTLDLYPPVKGTVTEINSAVVEDPSLIQDDPYDGWLFKIESDEEFSDEDEEDDDEDDEDEDDFDEDEEEEDEDYDEDEEE